MWIITPPYSYVFFFSPAGDLYFILSIFYKTISNYFFTKINIFRKVMMFLSNFSSNAVVFFKFFLLTYAWIIKGSAPYLHNLLQQCFGLHRCFQKSFIFFRYGSPFLTAHATSHASVVSKFEQKFSFLNIVQYGKVRIQLRLFCVCGCVGCV